MTAFLVRLLIIPALGVVLTGGTIMVASRRVVRIGALAIQYLFVTWLALSFLNFSFAAIRLLAGVITAAMLYLSSRTMDGQQPGQDRIEAMTGRGFRTIAYGVVIVAGYGVYSSRWFVVSGLEDLVLLSAIFLVASGLLQIGISKQTFSIGVGLITLLSGFELLYTFLEPSRAMLALQAAVHLALALVISYLDVLIPAANTEKETAE